MAKVELEGELFATMYDYDTGDPGHLQLGDDNLSEMLYGKLRESETPRYGCNYGRCRITIEQLPPDKSPEAVAKRVVARHRGALDILEEIG